MTKARAVPAGDAVFLLPGEVWFGAGPGELHTLLGSCVAMTLWHSQRRMGGMCHFVVPSRAPGARGDAPDGRYGEEAIGMLVERALAAGCTPVDCEVMLFGGGCMFGGPTKEASASGDRPAAARDVLQVPLRNIEQARRSALAHGLTVRAEHVGRDGHRRVWMNLDDGRVRLVRTPLSSGAAAAPAATGGGGSTDPPARHGGAKFANIDDQRFAH
jgi:chemotaxis protein CheD